MEWNLMESNGINHCNGMEWNGRITIEWRESECNENCNGME